MIFFGKGMLLNKKSFEKRFEKAGMNYRTYQDVRTGVFSKAFVMIALT
jgi:hypothetical protein